MCEGMVRRGVFAGLLVAALPAIALEPLHCPGDCNEDGQVSVDELVLGVRIALGEVDVHECPAMDLDGDGQVTVADLVAAVHSALTGCAPAPPPPTATPVAAATSTAAPPPPTATSTVPPSPTPTPTPGPQGPVVSYLGLAGADNRLLHPAAVDSEGRPLFVRPFGHGVNLIVEARVGVNGRLPGVDGFRHDPDDPTVLPHLQVLLSRPLGDGNPAVCNITAPDIGGVPAAQPFDYIASQPVADAINDLGCRVDSGEVNRPIGRANPGNACTFSDTTPSGFDFASSASQVQFCVPIAVAWGFLEGDTIVRARVADVAGVPGPAAEMRIRIEP